MESRLLLAMPGPSGAATPDNEVTRAIAGAFPSFQAFREQFTAMASGLFGSGWVWLVYHPGGSPGILTTANADTPRRDGVILLLTCDIREHACYIDSRNSRPDYLQAFWKHVDRKFVENPYLKAPGQDSLDQTR